MIMLSNNSSPLIRLLVPSCLRSVLRRFAPRHFRSEHRASKVITPPPLIHPISSDVNIELSCDNDHYVVARAGTSSSLSSTSLSASSSKSVAPTCACASRTLLVRFDRRVWLHFAPVHVDAQCVHRLTPGILVRVPSCPVSLYDDRRLLVW